MKPFLPVPDPVAFTVFGLDIMWYAVMITLGIVAGGYLLCKRAPTRGYTDDNALDMILYTVPVAVIFSRLYYVIFEWGYYSEHPDQILNFRGGGLAIHGAIIAVIIMALLLCRIKKQNVLDWIDLAFPGIALGQAIGRWGNYFNSEAHGTPTDLPWHILCDGELVHPTFLYESIWCFLLCAFLLWLDGRNLRSGKGFKGQIVCLYGMLYSVERFFVEGLRTDSLYLDAARTIRQAQVISVGIFAVCLVLYFYLKKKEWPVKEDAAETEALDEAANADETSEPVPEAEASDEAAGAEDANNAASVPPSPDGEKNA